MIIKVSELKEFIDTNEKDKVLEGQLRALELLVRKYTNNSFQNTKIRFLSKTTNEGLTLSTPYLKVDDTIQISQSDFNNGLYVITAVENGLIKLNKPLHLEYNVLVTKVEYPEDIKMGTINLMKWDLNNRDKVGIQSESISRHTVTYFNQDGDNSTIRHQ